MSPVRIACALIMHTSSGPSGASLAHNSLLRSVSLATIHIARGSLLNHIDAGIVGPTSHRSVAHLNYRNRIYISVPTLARSLRGGVTSRIAASATIPMRFTRRRHRQHNAVHYEFDFRRSLDVPARRALQTSNRRSRASVLRPSSVRRYSSSGSARLKSRASPRTMNL